MAKTHVMQRAPTPLLAMSAAEVAGVALAVGDCIEYRTLAMVPGEQPRVCCIREIMESGTIVLDNETWLSRPKLTWLKHHTVALAGDIADPSDPPDPSAPPAGTAERPLGTGAEPTLGAPRPPPASAGAAPAGIPAGGKTRRHAPRVDPNGTCRDCHKPFTRRSNVQKACPACTHAKALAAGVARRAAAAAAKGKAFAPRADATVIAARCALVAEWNTLRSRSNSTVAAAQLDTEANRTTCHAKHITRDILGWYANQYRGHVLCTAGMPLTHGIAVSASALSSAPQDPPEGGTPDAAPPPSGVPASAGPSRRPQALCDRLIAFADRLGAAEDLISRAERALAILEAYPEAGE